MSLPYMKLYVEDFLGKTQDLSSDELGAYILILMAMWQRDGTLPDDQAKLKRVARAGRNWPRIWREIQRYFVVENGVVTNTRLSEEYAKGAAKRSASAQSGALGGKAKALKDKEAQLANAMANAIPTHNPEYTLPKGNGEDDFAKQLFDRAVIYLGKHGIEERKARQFVGQMRHQSTDGEIFEAFDKAAKERAVDPMTYVRGILKPRPKKWHEKTPDELAAERAGI